MTARDLLLKELKDALVTAEEDLESDDGDVAADVTRLKGWIEHLEKGGDIEEVLKGLDDEKNNGPAIWYEFNDNEREGMFTKVEMVAYACHAIDEKE